MFEFTQADIVAYLRGNQWLVQNGFLPKYHAVLCDPPYALISINKRFGSPTAAPAKHGKDGSFGRLSKGFMGQSWDGWETLEDYQTWVTEWAGLMLDFVYPGAVGMFFGGTRTFHRLACGLEDAGWEVVDTLMYMYGSGFPKSADISKMIDKADGAEREVIDTIKKTPYSTTDTNNGWKRPSHNFDADPEIRNRMNITAPATLAAQQWDGWHSPALKPMYEPIILARAPRQGYTYAQLAQQFGSGALHIDGGRIAESWERSTPHRDDIRGNNYGRSDGKRIEWQPQSSHENGRFPGNVALVHSEDCTPGTCAENCPVRLLDVMSGERPAGGNVKITGSKNSQGVYGDFGQILPYEGYGDNGGASRFFYTAKASSFEREAGLDKRSSHPTLKPIQLIEWLATLLLPPKLNIPRRLLVPFSGVASEMIGAHLAGWDSIHGIEQSAAYISEAKQRAAWWESFASYDKAADYYASVETGKREDAAQEAAGQLSLF